VTEQASATVAEEQELSTHSTTPFDLAGSVRALESVPSVMGQGR